MASKANLEAVEMLTEKLRSAKAIVFVETKELTEGTTSFALGMEDGVAPSKLIYDFAKDFKGEKLKIKGGIIDGQVVDKATVEALAKLPSRSELLGMIAYGLLSPVRMLAVGLTNVAEQKEA